MAKQTAGRNILGEFAPQFAALNDDVLFGEVWSREAELPAKMRSIVTISALVGKGIVDTSLQYHLAAARENGVTREEMVEILTQLAFYAGWPNAWAAFRMAKDVYFDDSRIAADADAGMVVGDRIVESETIGNEQVGPGSYGGLFGLGQPTPSISPGNPISTSCRMMGIPSPFSTSLSNRDAAIIGTFTMRNPVVDRFSSVWVGKAGTRRGAKRPAP